MTDRPAPDGDPGNVRIKTDALRLLAARPRSIAELRSRLKLKKHDERLIDEVLDSLKKQGMLDDEKFARLYAGSRVHSRPAARRQLEFELRRKGLSKEIVGRTLDGLGEYDEKKAARDLVFARFHKMTGIPPEKKKARLFGFLRRRGFSTETALAALNGLFKDAEGIE